MKLKILAIADYAREDGISRKLDILGIFSRIYTSKFPAIHSRMVIVAKVEAELGDDTEPKDFSVTFADQDGLKLLEISAPFKIPHGEQGIRPDFNFIWELNGLEFPHAGHYQLQANIDGKELGTTSIELIQPTN